MGDCGSSNTLSQSYAKWMHPTKDEIELNDEDYSQTFYDMGIFSKQTTFYL